MANELQTYATSGKTVYAILLNAIGQAWNTSTVAFEAPVNANWATYKLAATEQGTTGLFEASMPGAIVSGKYGVLFYVQAGGTAAPSDGPPVAKGDLQWSGTAEIPLASIPANVWASATRTITAFTFTVDATVSATPSWYSAPPSAAAIATAVWTDTTESDFTVVGSPGQILVSFQSLEIAGTVNDNAATTTSFSVSGLSGTAGDYVGLDCCFVSGVLKGRKQAVTNYLGGKLSFTTPYIQPPGNGDQFVLI